MASKDWLSHRTGAIAAALALLAATDAVEAQIFVYPRRPGKSHVRYFGFDWRYVDIKVDIHPGPLVATTPESILWTPDAGVEVGSNVTPSGPAGGDHGGSGNPDGGTPPEGPAASVAGASGPDGGVAAAGGDPTGSHRGLAASGSPTASSSAPPGTPPPLVIAPAEGSGPLAPTGNEQKSGLVRLYFYERERLSAE